MSHLREKKEDVCQAVQRDEHGVELQEHAHICQSSEDHSNDGTNHKSI